MDIFLIKNSIFFKYFVCLYGAFAAFLFFLIRVPFQKIEINIKTLDLLFILAFILSIGTAIQYLFWPNYLDHIESSIASLGYFLKKNQNIYPKDINSFPYIGQLYGPFLSTIQSLFIQTTGININYTKIPGVASFIISITTLTYYFKKDYAKYYLFFLMAFGYISFSNRADPLLLLGVTLSLFVITYSKKNISYVILGVIAGLLTSVKIHGFMYILAIIIASEINTPSYKKILIFFLFTLTTFYSTFFFNNLSLLQFITYLKLPANEGVSMYVMLKNILYITVLTLPIGFLILKRNRLLIKKFFIFIFIELTIVIIASKPGAGVHHLMPLIPANTLLFSLSLRDSKNSPSINKNLSLSFLGLALVIFIFNTHLIYNLSTSFNEEQSIRKALENLQKKYGELLVAPSDSDRYSFLYYRVIFNPLYQINYAGYMDLEKQGVRDYDLANKIAQCRFNTIVMPKIGEPFSINNKATEKPLFQNDVRKELLNKYHLIESEKYFNVYQCKTK